MLLSLFEGRSWAADVKDGITLRMTKIDTGAGEYVGGGGNNEWRAS